MADFSSQMSSDAPESDINPETFTEADLVDIFSLNGLLALNIPGYEKREGQFQMALDALECYRKPSVYAVEAGTGIGKSFAYLIPALFYAYKDPSSRTVIATSTIPLQKQLLEKDIPSLFRVFGKEVKTALAVGRGNYICLRRLEDSVADLPSLFLDDAESGETLRGEVYAGAHRALSQIEADLYNIYRFSKQTRTGLKEDYKGGLHSAVWAEVSSDADLCVAQRCPFYQKCFYFRAKRSLSAASIVVCNHHLLFTDCKYRSENSTPYSEDSVLPAFSRLVIDEAHNIDSNALSRFTDEYSAKILRYATSRIFSHGGGKTSNAQTPSRRESGISRTYAAPSASRGSKLSNGIGFSAAGVERIGATLLEKLSYMSGSPELESAAAGIIKLIDLSLMYADSLNSSVLAKFKDNRSCLINEGNFQAFRKDLSAFSDALLKTGQELVESLRRFAKSYPSTDETERYLNEFRVYSERIEAVFAVLREFMTDSGWEESIRSVEIRDNSMRKAGDVATLRIMPLDVSALLRDGLFAKVRSVFCTSATLDVGDGFRFWLRYAGLPAPEKKLVTRSYGSPFDYKENLMLLTPYDAKDYTLSEKDAYTIYVTQAIENAVSMAGGGALVLFTGYEMMRTVYGNLKSRFALMGIRVMVQGEMERYELLEEFKNDRDSVLFATSSFWEGVDAPGDTLRLVIITKLPFGNPSEPVTRAREDCIERAGGSGFFDLLLPDAIIRLKQGFGRLIRHTGDRGIVLILDSRIVKKSYGRHMMGALPECYHPECTTSTIGERIENFLY